MPIIFENVVIWELLYIVEKMQTSIKFLKGFYPCFNLVILNMRINLKNTNTMLFTMLFIFCKDDFSPVYNNRGMVITK